VFAVTFFLSKMCLCTVAAVSRDVPVRSGDDRWSSFGIILTSFENTVNSFDHYLISKNDLTGLRGYFARLRDNFAALRDDLAGL